MVNLKPPSESMLPILRANVPPSLSLEKLLTQRHPNGADQTMILQAGFRGNELRAAVERGEVKMRDDWVFVWTGEVTPKALPGGAAHDPASSTQDAATNRTLATREAPIVALPVVSSAKLPATYAAAKAALSECTKIDECQSWANKAEAMASYARQAKDDELRKMADRIQARAIRRCGELLREIKDGRGANQNIGEGDHPKVLTRKDAAAEAGLSEHQRKTALRIANVPEKEFDAAVESDSPPTVTALAEEGRQTAAKTATPTGHDAHASDKRLKNLLAKIRDLTGNERFTLWDTLVDQWGEEINLAFGDRSLACSGKVAACRS
jgi:hypothetical protein